MSNLKTVRDKIRDKIEWEKKIEGRSRTGDDLVIQSLLAIIEHLINND